MALSINPANFLELLFDKNRRSRESVAAYLDSIAAEARSLANVWEIVIEELTKGSGRIDHRDMRLQRVMKGYKEPNAPYYYRLMHFYQQITQATGGKLKPELKESVINRLGRLLYEREITLKTYREALRNAETIVFMEDTNTLEDFRDLARLSTALHREAAAIEVLAKTIRTETA